MRRRNFIIGGTILSAMPALAAPRPYVIGWIDSNSEVESRERVAAFREGLRRPLETELLAAEFVYAFADHYVASIPTLAKLLVQKNVHLIVSVGNAASLAARDSTTTIPVLFSVGSNPLEIGLVDSLSKPSRNLTGVTNLGFELSGKRVEVLHELMPQVRRCGALINPSNPSFPGHEKTIRDAANRLGLDVQYFYCTRQAELPALFSGLGELKIEALVVMSDNGFNVWSEEVAMQGLRVKIPVVAQLREFAVSGGLASYGTSLSDDFVRLGIYASKIWLGQPVSSLPVYQQSRIAFIVNLQAARHLGIVVPASVLARADEVIE